MDFATIRSLLDAVETGADRGVLQAQRNATNLKGVVAQARAVVEQLEASGIDVLIANFDVKTFWNDYKEGFKVKTKDPFGDLLAKAQWLKANSPEWSNLGSDEMKRMVRLFPEVVERLYAEKKTKPNAGGSTPWGESTDQA